MSKFSDNIMVPSYHSAVVQQISNQLKQYHSQKTPYRIHHGGTNSTRPPTQNTSYIDTSPLSNIISLSTSSKSVVVEPNVSMSSLVDFTLPYGILPSVVPEFPAITVGGAHNGTAGESSSWRHGFFDRCVEWIEFVLPTGDIVHASRDEHADLFYGSAGALGTFGVATLFELKLEPTKKFVEVNYIPVSSVVEGVDVLQECMEVGDFDFLDGILFSPTQGTIIAGRLTDQQNHTLQRFSHAYHPWFYLHAASKRSTPRPRTAGASFKDQTPPFSACSSEVRTETTPIRDYLFRYDRGAFWMGKHAFSIFKTPFNIFTRTFLNPLLHTKGLYSAMHASGYSQRFIIQDLILPFGRGVDFVRWESEKLGVWPLWLCPIRASGDRSIMHATQTKANEETPDMLLNVGVWGCPTSSASWESDNIALEQRVADLNGKKWLYAQVFASTEDGFWRSQHVDRAAYEELRRKHGAQDTIGVWEKVRRKGERKEVGLRELWNGLVAGLWSADWRWGPSEVRVEDYVKENV